MSNEPTRSGDPYAGRSRYGERVHYFTDDETKTPWAICNTGPNLYDLAPVDWDPEHPDTCKKCRERLKWFKRGFRPYRMGKGATPIHPNPPIPSHT